MLAEDVVGDVADPQFEADCIVFAGEGTAEYVCGAVLVMRLPYQLGDETAGRVVVGDRNQDFSAPAQEGVRLFQEGVAAGDHFVLFKGVVGDVGVPARTGAFADLVESDRFHHRIWKLRFVHINTAVEK